MPFLPPKIINLDETEGHSGTGWSYYSHWLTGCNKQPWLANLHQVDLAGEAAQIGNILHRLLDFHESSLKYQDYILQPLSDVAAKASKIFANYRTHYPPGYWGKVFEREKKLEGHVEGLPYTGRQDGKVKITKHNHARWLAVGVPVSLGATYRLDYKKFTPPFEADHYLHSPQFTGYWRLDSEGLEGTLVLGINSEDLKRPPAVGLLIPPPTKEDLEIHAHCIRLGDAYSKPPYIPNPAICGFRRSYRCPFYLKECDLHTVEKGN